MAALFVGGPTTGNAQSAETALMLGIRYAEQIEKPLPYYMVPADSIERSTYKTLLLVIYGDDAHVAADRAGIHVPRGNGLWRVDVKRSVYNNWVEDFVWSAPVGRSATLPGIQSYNGEYCNGHRAQIITFASPTHIGIEQRSAGYCEDAAHPWFSNTLAVIPVDSTEHTGVAISTVLGRAGRTALFDAAQRFLSRLAADRRDQFYPEADEANWTPGRRTGRWVIRGRLDSEEVSRPKTADFEATLRLPAELLGYEERPFDWNRIVQFAPDASDAVVSPERDYVVILRPLRISVHPLRGSELRRAVLEAPVPPDASIVTAQWTTSQSEQWISVLTARTNDPVVGWKPGRE